MKIVMVAAILAAGTASANNYEFCDALKEAAKATVNSRDTGVSAEVSRLLIPKEADEFSSGLLNGIIDLVYGDFRYFDAHTVGALVYQGCMNSVSAE
jgi:hypothetical protein